MGAESGDRKGTGAEEGPQHPSLCFCISGLNVSCPFTLKTPGSTCILSPWSMSVFGCAITPCSLSLLSEQKLSIPSRIPVKTPPKMLTDKRSSVASGALVRPAWSGHHSCLQWWVCLQVPRRKNKNDSHPLPRLLGQVCGPPGSRAHQSP